MLSITALLLCAACGGGGGGGASSSVAVTCVQTGTQTGTACNPSALVTSSGSGVWVAVNNADTAQNVNLDVSGLRAGQGILLSVTNESDQGNSVAAPANLYASMAPGPSPTHHDALRSFHRTPQPAAPTGASIRPLALITGQQVWAVGNSRTWQHVDDNLNFLALTTTLRAVQALSDGRNMYLWVQDSEWNNSKITSAIVNDYAQSFSQTSTGIYDRVMSLTAGKVWGNHTDPDLISPQTGDIHVVMGNLVPDNSPYGLVGYFYALNNFQKTATGCVPDCSNSNESLAFFLDTETVYLGGADGQARVKSALMHELVHMVNFYQRYVLMGPEYSFDTWLEEMTAMTMQDLLETSFGIPHIASTLYMVDWVSENSYQCSPFVYDPNPNSGCFSYRVGSIYGAYLIRQYGLNFYKRLLASSQTDSIQAITQAASATKPGETAFTAARQMNAMAAMLTLQTPPDLYKLPAISGPNYSLPLISLRSYARYQDFTLPSSSSIVQGGASISQFTSSSQRWGKTITLPARSSLTIVLQN